MTKKFVPSFQSQIMAAFLMLIVLDGLYINDQMITFFVPVRYGLLGVVLVGIGIFFLSKLQVGAIKKSQFHTLVFHLMLLLYGLFLSSVNGGFVLFETRDLLFTLFSLFLTFVLILEFNSNSTYLNSSIISPPPSNFYAQLINFNLFLIILLIFSPLILYIFDAIELRPIPRINFDRSSDASLYLQATSRFFGLGAILFLFFALQKKSLALSIFFLSFSFVMSGLCSLGAARGELLISILVMIFLLFSFLVRKRNLFLIVICFAASFGFFSVFSETLDDLLITQRLLVFGSGNFGLRDQLLIQSFHLLIDRVDCALIGCGFNYFQVHFGNDYGMYPHNVFAELLITFGIPLGGSLMLLVCLGAAFGFLTSIKRTPLFWVLLYFLGINLKSGSLLGLTSIPVLLYFTHIGISSFRGFPFSLKHTGKSQNA